MKNMWWLLLSGFVIFADQVSKALAVKYLVLYQSVPWMPFLKITLAHNTGAAFSLLGAASGWQRWFFALIAIFASVFCLAWLHRLSAGNKITCFAISLLLGGALGNLWDRLSLGYVIDFVDFYIKDWHWPIFNIADAAICVGAFILLIFSFKKQETTHGHNA